MPEGTSNTRSTTLSTSSAAYAERSRSSDASAEATFPYSANTIASISVDLPEPVGPSSRKSPA